MMTHPGRARVVIAPDSFKASARAIHAPAWMSMGGAPSGPRMSSRLLSMADGGEGNLYAIEHAVAGEEAPPARVPGPTGHGRDATWLSAPSPAGRATLAVVELASTSGLTLATRAPLDAHTPRGSRTRSARRSMPAPRR